MDKEYEKKFSQEELIGKLSGCFAGLAIFVSCLGLFGMASFVAEQRTKEIGVRKVLGASVLSVWRLLSKDFVVHVFRLRIQDRNSLVDFYGCRIGCDMPYIVNGKLPVN